MSYGIDVRDSKGNIKFHQDGNTFGVIATMFLKDAIIEYLPWSNQPLSGNLSGSFSPYIQGSVARVIYPGFTTNNYKALVLRTPIATIFPIFLNKYLIDKKLYTSSGTLSQGLGWNRYFADDLYTTAPSTVLDEIIVCRSGYNSTTSNPSRFPYYVFLVIYQDYS